MEKKKTKKKWREIRSAVTMMCVMVAMLSTATYAWFTLTSNPVVNGLQMTAASSEGLKISKDGTTWRNAIDMMADDPDIDNTSETILSSFTNMYPATLTEKSVISDAGSELNGVPQFYSPDYTGSTVTGKTAITTKNTLNGYVASCTYYLKYEGTGNANIGLITADQATIQIPQDSSETDLGKYIGVTDGNPNVEGSFAKLVTDGDGTGADASNDHSAIEAIRVALVVGGNVYVYEPNSGTELKSTSTYATNGLLADGKATNVTPDVVSKYENGAIEDDDDNDDNDVWKSGTLFTLTGGTSTQVDMYVWFEGQDPQCVDQIMKDLIEVQMQFTVIE